MAIGQRLIPVICEEKEQVPLDASLRMMVDKQFADLPEEFRKDIVIPNEVYEAKKTATCPAGTKGRIGAFELLEMGCFNLAPKYSSF